MDLAAIGSDDAFSEQRVVGFHRLHLGDDGLAVGVAFERSDGLEIVGHRLIDAGLHHRKHVVLELRSEPLRELNRATDPHMQQQGG